MHGYRTILKSVGAAVLVALCLATPALAQEVWPFDETTSGNDIGWTSPTSVDPTAVVYNTNLQITVLDVTVSFIGIPFGPISLLDQVPPELQGGDMAVNGPAPISLIDQMIDFPGAPEPTSVAMNLVSGLDAGGSGFITATNVVLGTAEVDLGGIFGVVTVDITSIRLAGTLSIGVSRFEDLGFAFPGTNGLPLLVGSGTLLPGDQVLYDLSNALPLTTAWFVLGIAADNLPFNGGVLVPSIVPPGTFVPLPTDAAGNLIIGAPFPAGFPPGFEIFTQYWIVDAGAAFGFAGSNALRAVTP